MDVSGGIATFILKALEQTLLSVINFMTQKKPLPEQEWLPKIQSYFQNENTRIHGVYSRLPIVQINETQSWDLSKEQIEEAKIQRKKIDDHPAHSNDPHAILEKGYTPNWEGNPVIFKTQTTDFATVRVLKSHNVPIQSLSACTLIVCEESKSLILHKRSEHSDTYAGCYHMVGGSYMPKTSSTMRYNDAHSLKKTAIREIWEELGIVSVDLEKCTMILQEEPDTGFIQVCFLGAIMSKDQIAKIDGNYEGEFQELEFNQLAKLLNDNEKLVPTCKSAILAWLALDAPGTKIKPKFDGLKPKQLFKKTMKAQPK